MATITSAASGDSNVGGTWVGGIVPVVGDQVIIAATHIVTLVTTHNWGNDTNQGIIIRGTLKASRAVNSKLTARGDIFVDALGTYDGGTEADPIPSTVTHEIELNDSATMASNKWGFRNNELVTNWAGIRLWGATKKRLTELSSSALSTDTIINVTDATGWQVNDIVIINSTVAQASAAGIVYRKISAISANQVTLSSSVVAAKPTGTKIMNLTSNVRVYGKTGNTYASYFSIRFNASHTITDCVEIGETEFLCSSYTSSDIYKNGTLCLTWSSPSTLTDVVKRIYRPIMHNIWSVVGSTVTKVNVGAGQLLMLFGNQAYRYTIEEPIFSSENHYCMNWYSGTNTDIQNIQCIRSSGIASTGYSQGPVGTTVTGGYVSCVSWGVIGTGVIARTRDVTIDGILNLGNQTAYGIYEYKNCIFGPQGDFTASNSLTFGNGSNVPVLLENCTFQATGSSGFAVTRASSNLNNVASEFSFTRRNINNDVTLQDRYVYGGKQERDNSIYSNSLSSLRLDSWYSANPNIFTSSVNVIASGTVRIIGNCRYNTGYGTTYPATLTISGLGITPVVFTCPTSGADTWFPIDISATNPNAYPGAFTLTFQGQSTANTESASVYFSGIAIPDFVTVTRHYGFQFLNQTAQTINPYITETTEATVAAYTGITINHGTNTITISSSHSIKEIYDYVYYDLCLNANLSEPEYFTTTDGESFTTTYNIVNNSAITGTGSLTTTGTYTGSGSYTPTITDSTGVFNHITITGLVANSRVRINNETDNIELYNAVVAGTSVTIPSFWSTNKTLDVRVTNVIGTTAYLPYQTGGSLTATGASFLVSQELDTVYNTNAINGSTVTEFVADYPNIQVDIDDGDGSTSVQRLYAWFQYSTHSAQGIIYYFNGITAQDTLNYQINTNVVDLEFDNVSATSIPIKITGAYIYRDDGTTVIYSGSKSIQMDPARAYGVGLSGLTTEEHTKLFSLENSTGSGGLSINYSVINSHTTKKVNELKEQIEKLPNLTEKLNEIKSQNDIAKNEIIDTIEESEKYICKDIKKVNKELQEDNVATRQLIRQKAKKQEEFIQKQLDSEAKTQKMIESEADEIEEELKKIYNDEAETIEKEIIAQYEKEADEIESNS